MKELMYHQPFMKSYRFYMLILPWVMIKQQKNHFFILVVPLKSHNTSSDLCCTKIQLKVKLTFLYWFWTCCININVWKHPIYNQSVTLSKFGGLSHSLHPFWQHTADHTDRKEAGQQLAEDTNHTLLIFTSLLWHQTLGRLCRPSASQSVSVGMYFSRQKVTEKASVGKSSICQSWLWDSVQRGLNICLKLLHNSVLHVHLGLGASL